MNKLILLLLSICLFTIAANAKNESPKKGIFGIGFHTAQGLPFPLKINEAAIGSYGYSGIGDSKYGFFGGIFVQYKFKKPIALQLGLNYQKLTYKTHAYHPLSTSAYSDVYFLTLYSISVPIQSKFYFNPKNKIKIYAVTGISLDFLQGQSLDKKASTISYAAGYYPEEYYSQFRKVMTSATVGVGMEIEIKKHFGFFVHHFLQSQIYNYTRHLDYPGAVRLVMFTGLDIGFVYRFE